ncbi:phosphatase [Actinoplanes italicus]|uniref:Myo-inositol-1(Or 4)-monophosphatase n=1 Tax=Actinoplanes italicus TaxID=113567 RepID=A0A2T0K0K1_9ACTN|nr:inositol monophosphatase family protein [Actinoplanes italicus]PRX16286.1 myo-inositol-1(or 4)-monophosphatase [Actinoplanes italicus]GIE34362.1 phosphatase [Actinoplanes italicus]
MSINDRDLGIAAAGAGAAVVRAHYGAPLARLGKDGDDFATVADIEAEKAILETLRAARPDDLVLGEETGRTGEGGGDRMWLVDPLCGTLNYAVRNMLASVNVALRAGGRISVAVCADPFNDEVFWAGDGTAYVRRDGVDQPLTPSAESRLVDLNLDPPFPNRPGFLAARMLSDDVFLDRFRPRVVSTTLAVAWVAAGRRAAYVTDGHLADSVHFAAGIALCEAAGCVVTDLDGRPPHSGRGGLIAAADPDTHATLLSLVSAQRLSR